MTYDIIIVGGGIVGTAFASMLARQSSLSIAILEAQPSFNLWSEKEYHHRVSAIGLASQRIFKALEVWDIIKEKRISPFTQIEVWGHNQIEEALKFNCQDIAERALGFIIENNLMQSALHEKLKEYVQVTVIAPVKLTSFQETENKIELLTDDGRSFQAKLVIAADGAKSWLREAAGIEVTKHDYEQTAIVATVVTSDAHKQMARQRFLETGPLAFLPLADANTSSIVWSLLTQEAKRLMSLSADLFQEELAHAFSHRLGKIIKISARHCFPLHKQTVKNYIKSRVVLIGDAAHMVHPLAGQGMNMGLLDAASLAEVIVGALQKRRDFSSFTNLRAYERWRKADNLALLSGIDIIKNIFANNKKSTTTLHSLGFAITNNIAWLKKFFIRHAVGNRNGLPKLAQLTNYF